MKKGHSPLYPIVALIDSLFVKKKIKKVWERGQPQTEAEVWFVFLSAVASWHDRLVPSSPDNGIDVSLATICVGMCSRFG